jgi:VWFA-related protein
LPVLRASAGAASSNLDLMKFVSVQFGIVATLLSGVALAQTTLQTTTTLVVVPTLVQTQDKALVFSLKAEDFIVSDNGVPQKVRLEEESNRPLSLVVLMQTGGVAKLHFENYSKLDAMLAEILGKGPNEVSIVNFDSRVEAASPFTSDIAQWRDAIDHPDVGNSGAAILDSVAYGLELLKKEPASNRRAILLISQEHDDGSTSSLKEIVRSLGETNTVVYSVTFSAEKTTVKQDIKEPHLNPPMSTVPTDGTVKAYNDPERPIQGYFDLAAPLKLIFGAMQKNLSAEVATLSGGEASSFDNRSELDEALGRVNSRIRNSYILSFYPTSRQPGLHTIKVELANHPKLVVSARSSYWAGGSKASETKR